MSDIVTALRDSAQRLAAVSDTPRLDAELLMADALGIGRPALLLDPTRYDMPADFDARVARRMAHEPVAYILGYRDFWTVRLKVGPGMADGVTQGPLINAAAVAKVEEHIADALSKGAHVAAGGHRHKLGGTFFEPTVLTGVTPQMMIAKDETFGPVAPLFKFDTEEEAAQMANDTEFGLASYLYTNDLGRAWRMMEALEYGMVAINEGILSTVVAPFGGVKESGVGREGSKYGIEEYLNIKYALFGGLGK